MAAGTPTAGASAASAPMVSVPKDPYAAPVAGLSCPADAVVTNERCEGSVCLTQAPGGVTGNSVALKGKASGGAFTGLLVSAQHDRTKSVTTVNAASALKADGQFELTVPLAQLGSYTIVIQAMRVAGPPLLITARVSRVIAPHDLTAAAVSIAEPKSGEDHIAIAVDLEKSCRDAAKTGLPQDCDLIGSQTGATRIEATNHMASGREILRHTNTGSDGQFNLCMPLGGGDNVIEVRVCSPALASCVLLTTKTFAFAKVEPQVRWIDSDPQHLRFAIDHWTPKKMPTTQCDGEIHIQWNHEVKPNPVTKKEDLVQILCPVNGEYRIASAPAVGVNELSISLPGETGREFHYTFGWGKAVWAKDVAADIMAMRIDHAVLDRELPGIINRFLGSDEFPKLLQTLLTTSPASTSGAADTTRVAMIAAIRGEIPACKSGKQTSTAMRVIGTPSIGKVRVNEIKLESNRIAMDLTLDDVMVQVQYFKDADANGAPDQTFLPLKIGFKKLNIRPRLALVAGAAPQLLLTSDEDDCLYKGASYCKHRPSIVQPKYFQGSIDAAGAFVKCDGDDQLVTAEIKSACKSINNVDAKTGLISEQILEAFNETLYCDVSSQLTYALRHARIPLMQTLPLLGRKLAWKSELVLAAGGVSINADGVGISLGSRVESPGFYYTAGSVAGNAAPTAGAPSGHAVGLAVNTDVINQALAALTSLGNPGEGLLDWSIDEASIGLMGFEFTTRCDPAIVKGELPALCQMRPTIEKLLGSDLSTANYYAKDQPLRITIRGDRDLAPHVRFRTAATGEMVVDFDIPNVELSFAAIAKDPTQAPKPIIAARLTALLSFTLDKISTHAADPSRLALSIRLRAPESRVVIMPVAGSNRTILPDHVLVGQLRSLIAWGLEEFAKKGINPITLPKKFLLPATQLSESDATLFSHLGLAEIRFGEGDLQWALDPLSHAFTVTANPALIQRLPVGGVVQEYTWGQ
jgi:hypothetical protein